MLMIVDEFVGSELLLKLHLSADIMVVMMMIKVAMRATFEAGLLRFTHVHVGLVS